jgi:CDP-glucose 4,6-dehydratase
MVHPEFWRDRRVLVTGHTGFKGAWLCAWLQLLGAQVSGYALSAATHPSLYLAARIGRGMRSIEGDVRDAEHLARVLAEARPEVVFHLAAQPIVRQSYADPVGTFSTNVLGTVHLLDAVRRAGGVRAVVVVTSDKCYENREWYWSYREKSALGGRDPYSASKACAELVTRAYRDSFFAEPGATLVASARAGNLIGGGDWAEDRLVPDTVRALVEGRPVELRYPNAIRPWQHALDPLAGYLVLAERLHEDGEPYAEAWNFAPYEEDARTVGWLAERVQEAWGVAPHWRPQEGPRPHEHIFLKLDASKARALLGWEPRLPVASAVEWVADWYRAFYAGEDARDLVEKQIARFAGLPLRSAVGALA